MIFLDSDHFSVLLRPSRARDALRERLVASADVDQAIPLVVVEEGFRGWLAKIRSNVSFRKQIEAYTRLHDMVSILATWRVVGVTETAIDHFERLRKTGVRIGAQDLKIASIALANDALLLTANRRDFVKVPGLRFENWLVVGNGR